MSAARLLLLRHAEPDAAARGRCYGSLDVALSPEGARAASAVARAFAAIPLAAVYSSPAARARETARPLAAGHDLTAVVESALRELDFGDWEGLAFADIEARYPVLYRSYMRQPMTMTFHGGESYAAVRARVLALVDELTARHGGETIALVAHAGPLRAVVAAALALSDEAVLRIELGYAAASVVELGGGPPRVRLLNAPARAAARLLRPPEAGTPPAEPALARSAVERPPLPPGFDGTRARARRAAPRGWRFAADERQAVWRAIEERRDIRRFRADPVPEPLLRRLLEAAHRAPSVGLMQPWRFVVVRGAETKAAMQALAARERLVQAAHLDERARAYLDLKIDGIREAPLSVCVCCDRHAGGPEVLGRHTIPDTDLYSTCLAIQNLWLAARAEGVGVGWVSFYRPSDVSELLGLPAHVVPVAWLCLGYPDERPLRPGLEVAGWQARRPLDGFIHDERWREPPAPAARVHVDAAALSATPEALPDWWRRLAAAVAPGDADAALAVRDASDELVKPAGSLGLLELLVERWAAATGAAPPNKPRTAIAVFAAEHGLAARNVSLYPARVGGQVAAAAARGETAIGVLARALDAELVVADVGLSGPTPAGVRDLRVAGGSADATRGAALSHAQLRAAVEAGHALGGELATRSDLLVLGEIGIGNTTAASALFAALSGRSPEEVCGRGTGLDAQGLERKRAAVAAALAANSPVRTAPLECLRLLGGLELAALAGAMLAAAAVRRPVLLDGFATGVAALAACRAVPPLRDYLIAGHRSAEPAHGLVLTELGLEPLLDLRLRLGEASGAALALPLIGLAARTQREMSRFAEAGVEQAAATPPR